MTAHQGPSPALEALLLAYASGRLDAAQAVMVRALLALDARARGRVARYEVLGGRLIDEERPAALRPDMLEAVMARIDAAAARPEEEAREEAVVFCAGVPPAVAALLAGCLPAPGGWSPPRFGAARMILRVQASAGGRLYLMRLNPGQAVAPHRHAGFEMTLVLEGGFSDGGAFCGPGDAVIISDPAVVHAPRAGAEGCLCLVLTGGALRFHDPLRRALNLFFGV